MTARQQAKTDNLPNSAMFIPHEGHRNCAYTVLLDDQIKLYRLGLLPLRCRTCGDLFRDMEGA
jgi:hypothetical protein